MDRQRLEEFLKSIKIARNGLSDDVAFTIPALYPEWKPGEGYVSGDRVFYGDTLYKVLQGHTSQETWTPDAAPSLFTKVLIPDTGVIPEWEQPDSTNPYSKGDKVTYQGKTWISTVDNNVWAPDAYGWELVTE